jgi:hypothetical protein
MDGRYDKDAIPRLTPEPVALTTWRDDAAGKSTRRYYVVAVDALGQEGFPRRRCGSSANGSSTTNRSLANGTNERVATTWRGARIFNISSRRIPFS